MKMIYLGSESKQNRVAINAEAIACICENNGRTRIYLKGDGDSGLFVDEDISKVIDMLEKKGVLEWSN